MAGILFLLEVVAFLVVVAWAWRIERSGATAGGAGLLAMTGEGDPERGKRGPRYRRAAAAAARDEVRPGGRAAPRWRR
jgi:hypothetical protein